MTLPNLLITKRDEKEAKLRHAMDCASKRLWASNPDAIGNQFVTLQGCHGCHDKGVCLKFQMIFEKELNKCK